MTHLFKPTLALFTLMALILATSIGATVGTEVEAAVTPDDGEASSLTNTTLVETEKDTSTVESSAVAIPRERPTTVATIKANPWHNYENACETFRVTEGTKKVKNKHGQMVFPTYHKRLRFHRTRKDQNRTAKLIRMVAKEMGADTSGQYLVQMIAAHESSLNPQAVHILNPDLDANKDAWVRHSYNQHAERSIESKLKTATKKSNKDGYYSLKARLADIRMYKGNPHWNDQWQYTYRIPERTIRGETYPESEWQEYRSVWALGYGLFGMNAVLYTYQWDREAPPWVLCADDGIEAIVTAVWSLRHQQAECDSLTAKNPDKWGKDGGNARGTLRRFARGKCSNKRLGPAWRRLMKQDQYANAIDWDARPSFGTKWDKHETYMRGGKRRYKKDENGKRIRSDRKALLDHMRAKAEEKGLLRSEPLRRKHPNSEPVIRKRGASVAVVTN